MVFHPDSDEAFAAIKRGVERGEYYRAYRLDKAHYNDKLDDRILAEIRASTMTLISSSVPHRGLRYVSYQSSGSAYGSR